MSFAIEPIVNPTLDIPAPIVTVPPAGERASGAAPSFQDHLDRAGRSSDGPNTGSRSSASSSPGADGGVQSRRNDDAGERAEAERREETTANDRPAESTASKSDESKSKPTHGEAKVEEKKKPGEHHKQDEKKQGDEAATAAAVVVAGAQEPKSQAEVTPAGDEAAAEAEGTEAEIALPTEGKGGQGIGLPIDPALVKQTKEQAAANAGAKETDQSASIVAALAEADTKGDAAKNDGEATADAEPAVPLMSELHATKVANTDDKKPKGNAELTTEIAGGAAPEVADTVAAPVDATAAKSTTDGNAAAAVQAIEPEKEPTKTDGASAKAADPSFAVQLQGAVEAAAAAKPTVAATDVTNAATTTDSTASTPVATTTTNDAAKTGSTKTSDATLTSAESLRANSAKEATTGRTAGEESRQNDGLSTADRARLVQRVARAVRTATERGGELQIRLSPPELGQLRLQVQMTDGTLSARIEAESPQAKQVITENLGQLRERLAEQNIRVERIDVELMNTGNGGSPNLPDRRQDFSHDGPAPRGFAAGARNGNSGEGASVEAAVSSAGAAGTGRLNVVI